MAMQFINNSTILNDRIVQALIKVSVTHCPSGSNVDDRSIIHALDEMGFETERQVTHAVPGAEMFYDVTVTATGGDLEKIDEYQAKLYGRKAYDVVALRQALLDRLVELAPETYGAE